jgi:hypothetical protein
MTVNYGRKGVVPYLISVKKKKKEQAMTVNYGQKWVAPIFDAWNY